MLRRLILGTALLLTLAATPSVASAQDYNHRITVYATVAQMRAIYIDKNGNLVKVAGNTTANINPQVFDENNRKIAMTSSYQRQYQRFLADRGGKLEAGKVYMIQVSDLQPVKAVNREYQADHQTGDDHRYIGPELKMALMY